MDGSISRVTGLLRVDKEDGRVAMKNQIGEYTDLFDASGADTRKHHYTDVVNKYYDLATDFYEFGWGSSFHFAPRHKWESLQSSIERHELWLSHRLGLNESSKAIGDISVCSVYLILNTFYQQDIGCGVGGPLRNIAKFSGIEQQTEIVGLNNNEYQVSRARRIAESSGLSGQASYLKGDFMSIIPVPENSFDAAYAIEATCHAPDRVGVYSQVSTFSTSEGLYNVSDWCYIFKILKPGGKFASYEWVMTDLYDPQNAQHNAHKLGIERGNGLPDLESIQQIVQALKDAGFEVIEHYDRAPAGDIPWYYPLTSRYTPKGIFHTSVDVARKGLAALEYLRIAPGGSSATLDMLQKGADALVGAAETGIFTPMYWVLCRKPE